MIRKSDSIALVLAGTLAAAPAAWAGSGDDDPQVDPAILAIPGDPEYGEYLASECMTCHGPDGIEGAPSIAGLSKTDFVTAMQAYKTGARANAVMRMMAGRLSDEEIASLAAWFESVDQP